MKLRIISVTWGHKLELDVFCASLLLQTSPDWTCEIWHDGEWDDEALRIANRYADMSDGRITLMFTDERNQQYGHISRRIALDGLQCDDGDFVLISNCDNYAIPDLTKQVLDAVKGRDNVGLVYFDIAHSHCKWKHHKSELKEGGIDMTACAIRADIAKRIGFRWTHYSADGRYIAECAGLASRMGLCAAHIENILFVHN